MRFKLYRAEPAPVNRERADGGRAAMPPVTMTFANEAVDAIRYDADGIQAVVRDMGARIAADYAGKTVHLVAVLKGSIAIVADLLRAIDGPATIDFIAITSYGKRPLGSGTVRLLKDLDQPIEGRDVLVVEDVIDTGLTLSYILRLLRARRPASLAVATLVDKPARRLIELPIRYVGFAAADEFLVGYGLDYLGKYRNLPFLATLRTPDGRDGHSGRSQTA
jgi:hypoxanthine phosphoribosyltransferase